MAVVSIKNHSKLNVKLDLGKNNEGKVITKSKTFPNVNNEISNDDLMQVASALFGLQEYDVIDILRIDNTSISE